MQRYSSRNSEKNCAGTSRFQAFAPGIIINYKEKTNMNKKLEALQEYLKELGSVAIAFSSGVDSTFLLKVAHDVLGDQVKEEELVEGMQEEDGHTHEEEHTHDDDLEYDEHVWLSLKNASLFCDTIASSLADADPEHSQLYQQNAEAYEEKLAALDQEYQTSVEKSRSKTLLFADRFPFRYLIDDYNLTYYAAFAGCSAETDASFETITFLAGKLDELNLPAVLTIENSDQKVAKAVIENTNTKDQKILTLNSMQSVTTKDVEEGTTYLSIMENNLQILKEAL